LTLIRTENIRTKGTVQPLSRLSSS